MASRKSHRAPNAAAAPTPARAAVVASDVHRELLPDQSAALLQELHLLTRTGDLNADTRRKLKQINHLANLLRPGIDDAFARQPEPVLVDTGAGNAYLGFVLYELFFGPRGRGQLWSVEVRPDLVARGKERAHRLGYDRMLFAERTVADWAAEVQDGATRIDAVVALHACDTATDDALALGIRAQAPLIAVVPCCQAEVARLLGGGTGVRAGLGPLWRHPWHRREFGAHLTNVVRALLLEAHGYQVTVTELAGWEHSLKNELILARKVQRSNGLAIRQLQALLADLPRLDMQLLRVVGLPGTSGPEAPPDLAGPDVG
jgi:hypothetical protein